MPPPSGLSVLIVASMAMLFAVASAAFLLRARMADESCPHLETRDSLVERAERAEPQRDARCGEAMYESNPDGSMSIYFDLCSTSQGTSLLELRAVHPR